MIFQEAFSSTIGSKINFDIRIFVPIRKIFNLEKGKPLYFEIANYDGLGTVGTTSGLKFKVLPENEKQGLVGNCCNMRSMIYDDCLAQTLYENVPDLFKPKRRLI